MAIIHPYDLSYFYCLILKVLGKRMQYDGKLEVHLPYKTNGYRPCPCQKIILACKTKPYMLQFFEKQTL